MAQTATLTIDGKTYELPIIVGTEGEKAIDITKLRDQTGLSPMIRGWEYRIV